MRTKAIITGALAILATAALTANATNVSQRNGQGSVLSLVAATTSIAKADRAELAIASRSTAAAPVAEPTQKAEAAEKPNAKKSSAPIALTAGCRQAINNLKALRQADVAEDALERAGQPTSAAALVADRSEDMAEALKWRNALMAVRAACLPEPSAGCQEAISGLEAVVQALRTEELNELPAAIRDQTDWTTDWSSLRIAFSGVAIACARE